MKLPPAITFRGLSPSPAFEADVRKHVTKLETYYPSIMACRVLIELVQRRHRAGNRYHVRIDVTVPSDEIIVSHEASLRGAAQDVEAPALTKASEPDPGRKHAVVAVREAFDIARRRLQDYARRQRGSIKTPSVHGRGRVSQLLPTEGYGYIESLDGHDVYFQRSSVLHRAFDRLAVGSAVSFVEERGDKGPQASTVRLLHPRRAARRGGSSQRTVKTASVESR